MHEDAAVFRLEADTTVDEELRIVGDEPFEMTNLAEEDTGVTGVVFISTAMGGHGPRVKWFARPGRGQPSFSVSIDPQPRLLASSLSDRDTRRAYPAVARWTALNHAALLRFWNEGDAWTSREVSAFLAGLERL